MTQPQEPNKASPNNTNNWTQLPIGSNQRPEIPSNVQPSLPSHYYRPTQQPQYPPQGFAPMPPAPIYYQPQPTGQFEPYPTTYNVPHCPNCRSLDQTQKVSGIVSSGISVTNSFGATNSHERGRTRTGGMFTGHYTSRYKGTTFTTMQMTSTSTTILSQRLAPPIPPRDRTQLIVWGVVIAFLGFLCIASSLVMSLVLTIVGACMVGEGFNYNRKAFPEILARYRRANDKWHNLYYCNRCDGVFTNQSGYVPTGYMAQFLYD